MKPRFVSGIISLTWFLILLFSLNKEPPLIFMVSTFWFLGLLIGGKYRLLLWLLSQPRSSTPDISKEWGGAFWVSLSSVCFVAYLSTDLNGFIAVLDALAAPFSLCYGLSKIGCFQFNCCGWTSNLKLLQILKTIPLQLIETVLSCLLSIITFIFFLIDSLSLVSFVVFTVGHGLIRCFSIISRNKETNLLKIMFRFDSGLILLLGVTLSSHFCL